MTLPTGLRAAIVGAGMMGRWHAEAVRRIGAKVAAVFDADVRRAAALARRHRGCRAASSLEEAIEGAEVVHVCTPTPTHVEIVSAVAAAGRHALVEKPLASTAAETEHLLAMAASRGVLLCPVHQFLFERGVIAATRRLPRIGALRYVEFDVRSAGGGITAPADRQRVGIEILPHALSLLARLGIGVDRLEWAVRRPMLGEFLAIATWESCGIVLRLSMSGRPTANAMRLVGTSGTMDVNLFHGFVLSQSGAVSWGRKVAQPFTYGAGLVAVAAGNLLLRAWRWEPAYPGLRSLVRRFYAAAACGGDPPISRAEVVAAARAYEQLTQLLGGEATAKSDSGRA